MYGIVLMVAMTSGGQAAEYQDCRCGGWGYAAACWEGAWPSSGCCGVVKLGLANYGYGSGTPSVSAVEQKKWDDYVASLDNVDDRKDMGELWTKADLSARRQLIAKIPPPMKPEVEKKPVEKEKPLSAEEIKRWDAHVRKLTGDQKKRAVDSWDKADVAGKRKLLAGLPERE